MTNQNTTVTFTLNGEHITAASGETILQAAARHGVAIPHLCYKEGLRADGNCRACMVEIEGERALQPACVRQPADGMKVESGGERVLHSQRMVLELLQSDLSQSRRTLDSELDHWAKHLNLGPPRFEARANPQADASHPGIAVNLDACI